MTFRLWEGISGGVLRGDPGNLWTNLCVQNFTSWRRAGETSARGTRKAGAVHLLLYHNFGCCQERKFCTVVRRPCTAARGDRTGHICGLPTTRQGEHSGCFRVADDPGVERLCLAPPVRASSNPLASPAQEVPRFLLSRGTAGCAVGGDRKQTPHAFVSCLVRCNAAVPMLRSPITTRYPPLLVGEKRRTLWHHPKGHVAR